MLRIRRSSSARALYLRPALDRAGAPATYAPFHDLRHPALTDEAAAGNPLTYIQQRAGH